MTQESYYVSKAFFETELKSHPHPERISQIRMEPKFYKWLDDDTRKDTYSLIGASTDLRYIVNSGHEIPIVPDTSVQKGWIIDLKELEQDMATVTLTEVTINKLPIKAETTFKVIPRIADLHHVASFVPSLPPDMTVILEPSASTGADVHILHGMAQVLIGSGAQPTTVTIEGVNEYQPWVHHKLVCHLQEYETESGSLGSRQYARRLVFLVSEHTKTIIEDRVPKVNIIVSEEEAAYLQAMLIQERPAKTKEDLVRRLKNHVRRAILEVQGGEKK